jgi:hypothetical protein
LDDRAASRRQIPAHCGRLFCCYRRNPIGGVLEKLVEQMSFKSATVVKDLAGEFSKKLAEQGWKSDKGGDLITAKSAIVNRKRGGANLTIFVKPTDKGSTVTILTEGLDWEDKE